jgi:hypothetical protein
MVLPASEEEVILFVLLSPTIVISESISVLFMASVPSPRPSLLTLCMGNFREDQTKNLERLKYITKGIVTTETI